MAGIWRLLVLALHLFLRANADCSLGYKSNDSLCLDVDECSEVEDDDDPLCQENAQCENTVGSYSCVCEDGFTESLSKACKDINECLEDREICGLRGLCFNNQPHYSCICEMGFVASNGKETFRKGDNVTCEDRDECEEENTCLQNTTCINTRGSYSCVCKNGFRRTADGNECQDICVLDMINCGSGTCHSGDQGHVCTCHNGSTNYGNNTSPCTELNCDAFEDTPDLPESFQGLRDFATHLQRSCLELTVSKGLARLDGDKLLKRLLSVIDELLSGSAFSDGKQISTFLAVVENTLKLIGPFIQPPRKKMSSSHTDLDMLVHMGNEILQENVTLSTAKAQLNIHMQTAAGDPSLYPGFTVASALSYKNLEEFTDGYFDGLEAPNNKSFQMNSKILTVAVSNGNTSQLERPVLLRFDHLKQLNETHTCVFWDASIEGGMWSQHGCHVAETNPEYTVCSCNHLSSFAVLLALVEIEDRFELRLITWVGLSLSLVCLFMCILTFSLISSIQSPRTKIHLHLCVNLFVAILIFLIGITRTENKVGCAVIAGLLHYFYLAAFCWMCLEGVQLFRMVVLVFNTSFKTLYMMVGGYGVPAVIVAVSAVIHHRGYGTERYCWLSLDFMWSFFGPVCAIIAINIFFFFITVWKLAQKFSSLNPELDNLQKIRTFIITAVAQLCLLGTMWIFGCFQFIKGSIIMAYLFTIFGSLQGVLLFVMHCLLSKQVTDEYRRSFSALCSPWQTKYSDFSYVHSSKAHVSKSSQDTGESQI